MDLSETRQSVVETATGQVAVTTLGRTLMHEHVFTFHSDMAADYPWTEEDVYIDAAVDKLRRLKAVGFDTIVDLTVVGLGRDVTRVARIAERADVNVIISTGIYAKSEMPQYFQRALAFESPSFVEDFYVREISEGIGETGVRAAVIKCVTDRQGLTPDVETLLRSAARAQLRTGATISTHTDAFTRAGLVQQRVFADEGVDLSAVVIGHSGDSTDLDYLQELMDAGSYIGMDRFGEYDVTPLEDRVATVARLCERGYGARMVLSHDTNCGGDVRPERSLRNWLYGEIPEVVVPALRERGVAESDLDLMLIDNPRRIFAAAAAAVQHTSVTSGTREHAPLTDPTREDAVT